MEYYPSFFPETALAFLQALLWGMACVLLGAALIALCAYIALAGSEMSSQPRSKTRSAKVPQPAGHAVVAEETFDLSAAQMPILPVPEGMGEEALPVNIPPRGAQIPIAAAAALESESTPLL